jgi:hypothetical protein
MSEYNMVMNEDKTEHHTLTNKDAKSTRLQILGNYVCREIELSNRKGRAQTAFNSMYRIWLKGNKISIDTKVKLYNATVLPQLLYNAAAATYTADQLEKLNSTHRRHLRRMLGVFYPDHISNIDTYRKTKTRPVSIQIAKLRWKMLGHILRQNVNTPANRAMTEFYTTRRPDSRKIREQHRGGLINGNIPRLLDKDIQLVPKNKKLINFGVTELKSKEQLNKLR